jgi:hypothetical protein
VAAEPGFAHLPADVRPLAQLDAEVRIAHIRAERWIQHAAAERLCHCPSFMRLGKRWCVLERTVSLDHAT